MRLWALLLLAPCGRVAKKPYTRKVSCAAPTPRSAFDEKVVAYNQTTRGLTSLYSTVVAEAADPDHPLHDDFATRYRERAQATAALLRAGQCAGEIAPDIDPEAGARLISAVMDGIQQQWLLDATVDMTALFDEFVRGYLRAASPR